MQVTGRSSTFERFYGRKFKELAKGMKSGARNKGRKRVGGGGDDYPVTFVFRWETEEERGEKKKGGGGRGERKQSRKESSCLCYLEGRKGGKGEREKERAGICVI